MKIGFGRVDVTPPIGVPLAGYFEPRKMVGVLDPLELNAVVIEVGEDRMAVITADFLSMREIDCTGLRNLIERETGIPAQNILTQCLHQHTSIFAGNGSAMPAYYKQSMERKYVDVIKLALDDLAEATVTVGEAETDRPVSFIRRFRMKDGSVRTNPASEIPTSIIPGVKRTTPFVWCASTEKKRVILPWSASRRIPIPSAAAACLLTGPAGSAD